MLFTKNFIKYIMPSFVFVYLTYYTWIDLGHLTISLLIIATIIICFGFTKFILENRIHKK